MIWIKLPVKIVQSIPLYSLCFVPWGKIRFRKFQVICRGKQRSHLRSECVRSDYVSGVFDLESQHIVGQQGSSFCISRLILPAVCGSLYFPGMRRYFSVVVNSSWRNQEHKCEFCGIYSAAISAFQKWNGGSLAVWKCNFNVLLVPKQTERFCALSRKDGGIGLFLENEFCLISYSLL